MKLEHFEKKNPFSKVIKMLDTQFHLKCSRKCDKLVPNMSLLFLLL